MFHLGDGQDTIYDYDPTANNSDTLIVDADAGQLLFERSGANLLISILDTEDTITLNNWYSGNSYHVENIQSGNGYSLSHTQVDLLIQSMASFESESGMSWGEAVAEDHENANALISQIWLRQEA